MPATMADEPARTTSWWTTMPGVLTALAGIITALTGLVAILVQTGMIGGGKDEAPQPRSAASPPSAAAPSVASKVADGPTAAAPVASKPVPDGAATGVSDQPLSRSSFKGAVITRHDGSVTMLRDGIKEYCQGKPVLVTDGGQSIEMQRMKRFDVSNWNNGKGTVRIVLNNGESIDAKIGACYFDGTNDLGDVRVDFENIKSVEFVR